MIFTYDLVFVNTKKQLEELEMKKFKKKLETRLLFMLMTVCNEAVGKWLISQLGNNEIKSKNHPANI